MENQTEAKEFILLGFAVKRWLEILLFLGILITYFFILVGNIVIIFITLVDTHLKMPMYFFLRNYALLEISFTLVVIPKMLSNLLTERKTISLPGCFSQIFFFFFLGTNVFFYLSIMSFDRYVAVCNPLRYATIMNARVCFQLLMGSWGVSFLLVLPPSVMTAMLKFCGPNIINHLFCDTTPLFQLSCQDTQLIELMTLFAAVFTLLSTLAINIASYLRIIGTILRIPSAAGRKNAFSTCSAHLIVVSVLYGSCIGRYIRPPENRGEEIDKVLALLYALGIQVFTPFIYTLRNKQDKQALRNVVKRESIEVHILKGA
ncbi:olfactory receptor 6E1-like [Alligator mississippiensis]|uniref:olfactory receptor 6E1-like n=1 Tax=Alligator mississippiensis TaxID=8496 RepID=UPI0028780C11|nr:olfactory receptor 6E1-like [Alligator mississippiensis]